MHTDNKSASCHFLSQFINAGSPEIRSISLRFCFYSSNAQPFDITLRFKLAFILASSLKREFVKQST